MGEARRKAEFRRRVERTLSAILEQTDQDVCDAVYKKYREAAGDTTKAHDFVVGAQIIGSRLTDLSDAERLEIMTAVFGLIEKRAAVGKKDA